MVQQVLIPVCFILYHRIHCDRFPKIETIYNENVYYLNLQMAHEKEHSIDIFCKNRSRWNSEDSEQSIMKIKEYFETLQGTNRAWGTYTCYAKTLCLS